MNTSDLTERLRRHYIKPGDDLPGGAFLTEIQSHGLPTRRVDALYMGFTGSRGHHLHGFEVKTSRADWLTELGDPSKAEWWFTHTHCWWVVVPDLTTAHVQELPPAWGLMVPSKRARTKMEIVKPADIREPLVDFGLLFEIVKKIDTMRSRTAFEERRDRDHLVHVAVEKLRTSMQSELATVNTDRRGNEAIETLQRLSELTGLHLPGTKGRDNKMWCQLEEAGDALVTWCQGQVKRQRAMKRTMQALRSAHTELGLTLGELGKP